MTNFIKRLDSENYQDYAERLSANKAEYDLTWQDIADNVYENYHIRYSPDFYRKSYKRLLNNEVILEVPEIDLHDDEEYKRVQELTNYRDRQNQLNAYLRKLTRLESYKDIAITAANIVSEKKPLCFDHTFSFLAGDREGILIVGDWHYGIEISNYWNTYNPDIAKKRIEDIVEQAIEVGTFYKIKKLHFVNLGDLISGRIHSRIRIENRINVVQQTTEVSEILAEVLVKLASIFDAVEYYDCLDNHSRCEPNLKDSLDLESFARFIPWYLKARLPEDKFPNIHFNTNKYDEDIISFESNGHKIAGVHGDKDRPTDVIDNICMFTHDDFELILTAHNHHFAGDEKNEILNICNGSLMGTDDFAKGFRLSSIPSQNMIITSSDNVLKAMCKLNAK